MEPLKFTAKTNTIPFEVDENKYELREMSAGEREAYMDTLAARTRFDENGKPLGIKHFAGMHADLLTRCTYTDSGKPVGEKVIQGWPSEVAKQIFAEAQKLNHLDGGTEEATKNA